MGFLDMQNPLFLELLAKLRDIIIIMTKGQISNAGNSLGIIGTSSNEKFSRIIGTFDVLLCYALLSLHGAHKAFSSRSGGIVFIEAYLWIKAKAGFYLMHEEYPPPPPPNSQSFLHPQSPAEKTLDETLK